MPELKPISDKSFDGLVKKIKTHGFLKEQAKTLTDVVKANIVKKVEPKPAPGTKAAKGKGKGKNAAKPGKKVPTLSAYLVKQGDDKYFCFAINEISGKTIKAAMKALEAPIDEDWKCYYISPDDMSKKKLITFFEEKGVNLTVSNLSEKKFLALSLAEDGEDEPKPANAKKKKSEPVVEDEPEGDDGDDWAAEEPETEAPAPVNTDDDDWV